MLTATNHPFDFARAGRQQARAHLAALVEDDRHVPLFVDPPDALGLAVEAALGRPMTDDEFDVWRAAFVARFDELADEHRTHDCHPRHLPTTRIPLETYL